MVCEVLEHVVLAVVFGIADSQSEQLNDDDPQAVLIDRTGVLGPAMLARLARWTDVEMREPGSLDAALAQLAVAWTLHQPGVTAALVGTRTPAQALENARAARVALAPEEVALLSDRFEELDLPAG